MSQAVFTCLGITANCGNDSIGSVAISNVIDQLGVKNPPTTMVLNLQEVDLNKSLTEINSQLAEFNKANNTNYSVAASELMMTRTKPWPLRVLFGYTGIASIAIYDANTVTAEFSDAEHVRRKNPWFIAGTAANKGGLKSRLHINYHHQQADPITIDCLSGHLDSKYPTKRLIDWAKLKKSTAIDADSWVSLVEQVPHLHISGYDANTRNLIIEDEIVNPWSENYHGETRPFLIAPMGDTLYSAGSTYKNDRKDVTTLADKKRVGYTKGGSLDFVAIQNNTHNKYKAPKTGFLYSDAAMTIDPEEKSERDHTIIGSNIIQLEDATDFDRVKHYLIKQLQVVCPTLVKELSILEESKANRQILLNVQQTFLSSDGLINRQLNMPLSEVVENKQLTHASLNNLDHYRFLHLQYRQLDTLSNTLTGWFTPSAVTKALQELKSLTSLYEPFATPTQMVSLENKYLDAYKKLNEAYESSSWWRWIWFMPVNLVQNAWQSCCGTNTDTTLSDSVMLPLLGGKGLANDAELAVELQEMAKPDEKVGPANPMSHQSDSTTLKDQTSPSL